MAIPFLRLALAASLAVTGCASETSDEEATETSAPPAPAKPAKEEPATKVAPPAVAATSQPASAPLPIGNQCPTWKCGENHNRRMLRES